ncbi:hypothetical protein LX36DRAFT_475296 [Colletotrichum falcatum]|nr:hypothetical protein LX36DRAFT_475296 [Colletotrichum falcatum]
MWLSSPIQAGSQQWDESISIIPWLTPRRPADLRHQLYQYEQLGKDGQDIHTFRHLSRKVQKGYNEEVFQKTLLQQENRALKA